MFRILSVLLFFSASSFGSTSTPPPIPDLVLDWPLIGQLKTRDAREIEASSWSIGCEVLDRDLADFNHFKSYLGPLGAKHARMQAGWAKTERQRGVYDWSWLDVIVDDALAQSVQPWLQLSYGNPLYPGGGGPTLGDGVPTSPEALAAWDNWVRGTIRRFKNRVTEWEVWNEPEGSKKFTVEEYTRFYLRTAAIIRAEQPAARIYALAFSSRQVAYAEGFLLGVRAAGKLDLIDAITFHAYPKNPDDLRLDALKVMLAKHGFDKIPLRQGETGVPSTTGSSGALGDFPGSELTQAKWVLRRMLAHHAEALPFNLFLLMEFDYAGQPHNGINSKGLLKTNPDKTVAYPKAAYFAAQRVHSLFDASIVPVRDSTPTTSTTEKLALHAYHHRETKQPLVAAWLNGDIPNESLEPKPTDLTLRSNQFREPVLADLRTGKIYAIPSAHVLRDTSTGNLTLRRVPLYDSPIIIAEKSLLLRE